MKRYEAREGQVHISPDFVHAIQTQSPAANRCKKRCSRILVSCTLHLPPLEKMQGTSARTWVFPASCIRTECGLMSVISCLNCLKTQPRPLSPPNDCIRRLFGTTHYSMTPNSPMNDADFPQLPTPPYCKGGRKPVEAKQAEPMRFDDMAIGRRKALHEKNVDGFPPRARYNKNVDHMSRRCKGIWEDWELIFPPL